MAWSEQVFIYCERGQDPAFWAEPLNAVTNAAFIIAALLAAGEIARRARGMSGVAEAALIALVIVIGTGSFLFHTFATRWAQLADWGPIAVFMLAYLAYVLRRFLKLNWAVVALGLALFLLAMRYAGGIECRPALLPVTALAGARCLNGSLAYAPALATLALMAGVLAAVRHPAWRYLATASGVLLVSLTLRTLDLELCSLARVSGRALGTHFLWHLLNALTLYILLIATLRHGGRARANNGGH
jgi:hypothetical protein